MRDYIELFMWGFQAHFRRSVEFTTEAALRELGVDVDVDVFLLGLLEEGGAGHPICIEPEDGPLTVADFEPTAARASALYEADPERQIRNSDRRTHELRQQALRDAAWCRAIVEVAEGKLGGRFFVAMPTRVGDYRVFTAMGLPEDVVDQYPSLTRSKTTDDDRIVLRRSLLEGGIWVLLSHFSSALYGPDPGSGFGHFVEAEDVARAAGERLAIDVAYRADSSIPAHSFFDAMNQIATTSYEKRAGLGRLVVASANSPAVDRVLLLDRVVPMKEIRTVRKLLETSSRDGAALLTNGVEAYGLGVINPSYEVETESVFEIVVSGPGSWDLRHAGTPLMTVLYGAPHLPAQRLSRSLFEDTATRLFEPVGGCDSARLWDLAMAAADAEHGTMLVVSAQASTEAARLQGQALIVHADALDPSLVRQVTTIDGAILVDPRGALAAIGVILDGVATAGGDRARGARFNSAVRYLASAPLGTMIVLVSEDGMLDLMPRLRARRSRAEIKAMLDDLEAAAAIEPVDGERFYKAFNRVKALAFYLSNDQCAGINALVQDHWSRRKAAGATIWFDEPPLVPAPQMTDEYLTD